MTTRKALRPADLHAAGVSNPLSLAAQGFFWTGTQWIDTPVGAALRGQMYVEYWIPDDLCHPLPIVMVHGGGGQGLDYLGTADGREGWAHWFVRRGYAVYIVDRPGHGRSPFHPDLQGAMAPLQPLAFLEEMFCRPEDFPERYAQARLHDKWPGSGRLGDGPVDHFIAGTGPAPVDLGAHHLDCQRGIADLLDRIGPAIVMTHSAGGPTGWLAADARPDRVKAIIAVEPVGPPFAERPSGTLDWGITAAPLTFDPPVHSPDELEKEERPPVRQDTVACYVQREPARQLPHLRGIPIVIMTAEASWMAADNHGIVDFLAQAGASVEHLRLEERGVHGNGHAMMLETNSDEVAATILRWIEQRGLA